MERSTAGTKKSPITVAMQLEPTAQTVLILESADELTN